MPRLGAIPRGGGIFEEFAQNRHMTELLLNCDIFYRQFTWAALVLFTINNNKNESLCREKRVTNSEKDQRSDNNRTDQPLFLVADTVVCLIWKISRSDNGVIFDERERKWIIESGGKEAVACREKNRPAFVESREPNWLAIS